jgi:hypothetical protein
VPALNQTATIAEQSEDLLLDEQGVDCLVFCDWRTWWIFAGSVVALAIILAPIVVCCCARKRRTAKPKVQLHLTGGIALSPRLRVLSPRRQTEERIPLTPSRDQRSARHAFGTRSHLATTTSAHASRAWRLGQRAQTSACESTTESEHAAAPSATDLYRRGESRGTLLSTHI